jgi:hypothetical protein
MGTRLPAVPSGRRLWGQQILKPLGFRLEPDLAETTVLAALGVTEKDLLLVDADGVQTVSREVLRPLHRASLRRVFEEVKA